MTLRDRLIRLGDARVLTQGAIMGLIPEAVGFGYYYPQ